MQTAEDRRQRGTLRFFPNQQTREAIVERADEKTDEELDRLQSCRLLRNPEDRGILSNKGMQETALE